MVEQICHEQGTDHTGRHRADGCDGCRQIARCDKRTQCAAEQCTADRTHNTRETEAQKAEQQADCQNRDHTRHRSADCGINVLDHLKYGIHPCNVNRIHSCTSHRIFQSLFFTSFIPAAPQAIPARHPQFRLPPVFCISRWTAFDLPPDCSESPFQPTRPEPPTS